MGRRLKLKAERRPKAKIAPPQIGAQFLCQNKFSLMKLLAKSY